MAKNTKNNLYDIEKDNKKSKKNNDKKHATKKKQEKTSFDNEIIIGVTNLTREHVEGNNKKKKKNISEKQSNKSNKKINKTQNKKKDKNKKEKKTEIVEKVILDEEVFLEQRREERKEKRKRNFKIAKIVMAIGLVIATVLIILFSPLFNVKEIEVKNNDLISTEEILSLAGIKVDDNTFKINTGKVSEKIKSNLYIEDAEIVRELPSKIIINIKERKPSFIIEYANGYATIDQKGYILELNETKRDLPVLQGLETVSDKFQVGKNLEKNDLYKVYIVSKIMDIANNIDMNGLITRIDIDNTKEIKIIMETKEKTAYLGDDTNLNYKLQLVKKVMEENEGVAGEILVNENSHLPLGQAIFRERV